MFVLYNMHMVSTAWSNVFSVGDGISPHLSLTDIHFVKEKVIKLFPVK